jgi:hypothetical protein
MAVGVQKGVPRIQTRRQRVNATLANIEIQRSMTRNQSGHGFTLIQQDFDINT